MKKRSFLVSLFLAIAICCAASPGMPQETRTEPAAQLLIFAGSGANLGITRLLAKAFMAEHPGIIIEIPGSIGSKGAIAAIADSGITVGLLSQAPLEKEQSPGVVVLPYARVPIVIAVHPTVPDDDITLQELVEIYRGTKTRWKDGNEIVVQCRQPTDSGFRVISERAPGFGEAWEESIAAKRWSVYFTDQDANRALIATRYAVGITDLGMVTTEFLNVKVLKLNGVVPGPESLLSGQYPFVRDLSFLYREATLPKEAKVFLDFVRSEEGGRILKAYGYLPLQ